MKIKINAFDNEVIFEDARVNVLEILPKKLFVNLVSMINDLILNIEMNEDIILIENDKKIEFSKNAVIIFDIFNIDFNQKTILTKLANRIESEYKTDEGISSEIDYISSQILNLFQKILMEFPFDFDYKNYITISDLIKAISIKIDTSKYETPLDKILGLIDIFEIFDFSKLLILCNIKSYFEEEQLLEIYKYAMYKKVKLLIIEPKISEKRLKYEKKLQIDENFDDMLIE